MRESLGGEKTEAIMARQSRKFWGDVWRSQVIVRLW